MGLPSCNFNPIIGCIGIANPERAIQGVLYHPSPFIYIPKNVGYGLWIPFSRVRAMYISTLSNGKRSIPCEIYAFCWRTLIISNCKLAMGMATTWDTWEGYPQ